MMPEIAGIRGAVEALEETSSVLLHAKRSSAAEDFDLITGNVAVSLRTIAKTLSAIEKALTKLSGTVPR